MMKEHKNIYLRTQRKDGRTNRASYKGGSSHTKNGKVLQGGINHLHESNTYPDRGIHPVPTPLSAQRIPIRDLDTLKFLDSDRMTKHS